MSSLIVSSLIVAGTYLYYGTQASISQSLHVTSAAEGFISQFPSMAVTPFVEYLDVPAAGHSRLFKGDQFWAAY